MRATGKASKSVRGDVAHYGIEDAEIGNAKSGGKRFGGLYQRKLRYQGFYPFFLAGLNILSPAPVWLAPALIGQVASWPYDCTFYSTVEQLPVLLIPHIDHRRAFLLER